MRRNQDAVRGTACRQPLLGLGHLEVVLQLGNHHDQQRRPQGHGAGLVQGSLAGIPLVLQRFGEQLTQLLAALAFDGEKAPRPQLAVVRGAQGGLEQRLALGGIGRRVGQAWHGNTVEQCVESLHRLPSWQVNVPPF
ncbi:hypothetical protein D3C72_1017600 [compost metagenome]